MQKAPSSTPHPSPAVAKILARVQAPGQYVGGEPNQIVKPEAALRLALAFPDLYSVGMSHLGLRILYEIANRMEGVAAERVFAPAPDLERELRAAGQPLFTLETGTALGDCQLIGFSYSYELAASSILTMLDLGGVPLTRFDRAKTGGPLVMAGGYACLNPEPISDFIDFFVLGEAEEALPEILSIALDSSGNGPAARRELLLRLAREVKGVYVPELYRPETLSDGTVVVAGPAEGTAGAPFPIERRVVRDFNRAPQVERPVVPIHETVHERAVLEIMRGCPNGCRFCQAGYITRPVRERDPDRLVAAARSAVAATGFDDIGLLSLSTSNYSRFDELLEKLDREFAPQGVGLSLPSLRVDHALSGIPARVKSVRKSGLTVAPEAGTDRLRRAINKDVTNENLLAAAAEAFRQGWRQIKLYFMVGLPTETDDDLLAIAALAREAGSLRRRGGKSGPCLHLSVSNFVPKPFTAFQWTGASGMEAWKAKHRLLAGAVDRRLAALATHDPATSLLEAVFARGDRRLGRVILAAWKKGARLDAWTEHFSPSLWFEAFAESGLDPTALACREIPPEQSLPWDHVDIGVAKPFLLRERDRAYAEDSTPACAPSVCAGCGVEGCGYQTAGN